MDKMWATCDYLRSPELVVKIQKFFGVKYLNDPKTMGSTNIESKTGNGINHHRIVGSSDGGGGHVKCHKRNESDNSDKSSDYGGNNSENSEVEFDDVNYSKSSDKYEVTNRFWYHLFVIGTALGDEIFYATFIPFWFWNIDGAVGRRVIFVWSSLMYVGQGFKDIIRWPRPGPPCVRLQKKWALEYGMPSTHAMVALSIPFSVLIYTMNRYQYNVVYGLIISIIWCTVICLSRLYLGMHSVLDIIAGLLLTVLLMIPLIPIVDYLDRLILESWCSPIFVLTISILLIIYYPDSDKWTPTRGDTTLTVSVCAGIQIGAWINFQLGNVIPPTAPPPYEIIWPSHVMIGLIILRTVLGLCCIVATRAIGKSLSYAFISALLGRDKNELRNSENSLENRDKTIVELSYKYFTYGMIGLSTQYLLPNVFKMLGIGRPDFYTEF